ncbi:hypothetical protein V1277_006278 [Bradyrhizobium sp. AZCC 1588]|uniref:hypothetical protein n=1 Tax=unclassified Bradyrhizobium TaxID=2631580 RepID=UPI002FF14482
MKACNALIVWTPTNVDGIPLELRGRVEVRTLQSCRDWIKPPFSRTGGASSVAVRKMTGLKSELRLFIEFQTLVVRDGIDPQKAHKAFLAIDEYRKLISPDCVGAE